MKRQWRKLLTITGMVSMMSLTLYGCGDGKESPDTVVDNVYGQRAEEPEDIKEWEGEDQGGASAPEENTSSVPQEDEEADLLGDISEVGEMQFTVTEVISEESEDGSEVMAMIAPAPGSDDSDFNHVTVAYDEETVFYIRKIYDNGARYEDLDASAEDLKTDALVGVWGGYGEDGGTFHAVKVQINQIA